MTLEQSWNGVWQVNTEGNGWNLLCCYVIHHKSHMHSPGMTSQEWSPNIWPPGLWNCDMGYVISIQFLYQHKDPQIFQKSRSHCKILHGTKATWASATLRTHNLHSVNSCTFFYTREKCAIIMLKILGAMVQTGVAWVTRHPGYVYSWYISYNMPYKHSEMKFWD
jgi:hypothetical protein